MSSQPTAAPTIADAIAAVNQASSATGDLWARRGGWLVGRLPGCRQAAHKPRRGGWNENGTLAGIGMNPACRVDSFRISIYDMHVIASFKDAETERIFHGLRSRSFGAISRTAYRKLAILHSARTLNDLKGPGLHLEALKDDRVGQHSIRINDRYRVCFEWRDGDARNVEIVDYH